MWLPGLPRFPSQEMRRSQPKPELLHSALVRGTLTLGMTESRWQTSDSLLMLRLNPKDCKKNGCANVSSSSWTPRYWVVKQQIPEIWSQLLLKTPPQSMPVSINIPTKSILSAIYSLPQSPLLLVNVMNPLCPARTLNAPLNHFTFEYSIEIPHFVCCAPHDIPALKLKI